MLPSIYVCYYFKLWPSKWIPYLLFKACFLLFGSFMNLEHFHMCILFIIYSHLFCFFHPVFNTKTLSSNLGEKSISEFQNFEFYKKFKVQWKNLKH